MATRFFVNGLGGGAIEAEMDGERDTMTAYKFMAGDTQAKANEYARGVAAEMTTLYNSGHEAEAIELFEEAEAKLKAAMLAESFCETVSF